MMDDTVALNELMRKEGPLSEEQTQKDMVQFEFHAVRYLELGMTLFEREFHTWSLRYLCDIGPFWYKICHEIGNGWWANSENVEEASHKVLYNFILYIIKRKYLLSYHDWMGTTEMRGGCASTTRVLKMKHFRQFKREDTSESISNLCNGKCATVNTSEVQMDLCESDSEDTVDSFDDHSPVFVEQRENVVITFILHLAFKKLFNISHKVILEILKSYK